MERDEHVMKKEKEKLSNRFKMKDPGMVECFLGIDLYHDSNGVHMTKNSYVEKLLEMFRMPLSKR